MKCYSNIHLNTDSMIEEEEDEDLILTEDLEDDAPAAPMAEAPVEEPSAEEEEPMLDFDFEGMIPAMGDTDFSPPATAVNFLICNSSHHL